MLLCGFLLCVRHRIIDGIFDPKEPPAEFDRFWNETGLHVTIDGAATAVTELRTQLL